jgi:hypothetical protein
VEQNRFATQFNLGVPKTNYIEGYFENLLHLGIDHVNTCIAVESLLHVRDKERVLNEALAVGVKKFVLAEVCLEDNALWEKYPLFNPSLKYTWTSQQYEDYFRSKGMKFCVQDLTSQVYEGWSRALSQIDSDQYRGNGRVLRHFKESYSQLSELGKVGKAKYLVMAASAGELI